MICGVCKNDGVLVELQSCKYYYCRTCKEEIQLETANGNVRDDDADLLAEFERMVNESGIGGTAHINMGHAYDDDFDDDDFLGGD